MVRSELLTVPHGFGARVQTDPLGSVLPKWRQVHGVKIARFDRPDQDLGDIDGIYSRSPGLTVAVRTADCVPILLAREDGAAAAALHAGWRGSLAGIVTEFGKFLETHGEAASRWSAAIGPSARACCYEVSAEIAEAFRTIVPAAVHDRNLDLAVFNAARLHEIGVQKIDVLPYCTICARDENGYIFHSFRREKGLARQVSWLTLSSSRDSSGFAE